MAVLHVRTIFFSMIFIVFSSSVSLFFLTVCKQFWNSTYLIDVSIFKSSSSAKIYRQENCFVQWRVRAMSVIPKARLFLPVARLLIFPSVFSFPSRCASRYLSLDRLEHHLARMNKTTECLSSCVIFTLVCFHFITLSDGSEHRAKQIKLSRSRVAFVL